MLLYDRTVIPQALRKQILQSLHYAHQGWTGMKARANQCVYWPGMRKSLSSYKAKCGTCIINSPSQQREPLILSLPSQWPFQQVCGDFFSVAGHDYLSVADRFSGWICIYHLGPRQCTSSSLISVCQSLLTVYGAPEQFTSDGSPQLNSTAFKGFLLRWGVKHRLSSVEYPQSNGRAELGVKAAKRIIYDNTPPNGSLDNYKAAKAIMQYQNTPLPDLNRSLAQILFHRNIGDCIQTHPSHYELHKE